MSFSSISLPVEEVPVLEYLLHRIHVRAVEHIAAGRPVFGGARLEHLLHQVADTVSVFGEHHIVEVVDADEEFAPVGAGDAVGEGEDGADVVVIDVPAEREYALGGLVDLLVEHEVRARKLLGNQARVVVGGCTVQFDDGGPKFHAEVGHGADVQQRQAHDAELPERQLHVEECLLQQGVLSGLGGLVHHDVFAVAEEVRENGDVGFPSDEVPPRYGLVEDKGSVHFGNIFVSQIC